MTRQSGETQGGLGEYASLAAAWALGRMLGPAQAGSRAFARARSQSGSNDAARAPGDRGHQADSPTQIPPIGWWDVVKRTFESFNRNRLLAVAAGVTFYVLLAIFPGIAAFVSLYGLFANASDISSHLNAVSGLLPGGAVQIIQEQVTRIASKGSGTLGFGFAVGLLTSLWSSNAGIKALFDSMNIVYGEEEKRSFVWLNIVSLTFTIGAIAFLIIAISAVAIVPIILTYVGLGAVTQWIVWAARWPALLLVLLGGLALLYRYGPSRSDAKWRWITPGSAFAALVWIAFSMLFAWYVGNFGNYNETYGTLGAAIGFMTWIWLSIVIILLGGTINAELEHQTEKDTTTKPAKPMGDRGAHAADTVAAGSRRDEPASEGRS